MTFCPCVSQLPLTSGNLLLSVLSGHQLSPFEACMDMCTCMC